jgi:glycosyltransferase involved in cell wall biosynthesis
MRNGEKETIVHVITTLNQGGAETMLRRIVNTNTNHDHLIVVLKRVTTDAILKDLRAPFVKVNLCFHPGWIIRCMRLFLILRKKSPTIIMGWMYHGMVFSFFLSLFFKCKLIFNFRQTLYNIKNEPFLTQIVIRVTRVLSYFTHGIIYNSVVAKHQHEAFGFCSKNVFLLPNGFSPNEYFFSENLKTRLLNKYGVSSSATKLGVIARFHPMKGHFFFLSTLNEILVENPHINLHLFLAGHRTGAENSELDNFISSHPLLRAKTTCIGQINNSNELLSALDCLCVPSLWGEGFPNIIGEAILSNVFCIGSDIGDTSLLIHPDFVFKAGDKNSLKGALLNYLDLTPERAQKIKDEIQFCIFKEI